MLETSADAGKFTRQNRIEHKFDLFLLYRWKTLCNVPIYKTDNCRYPKSTEYAGWNDQDAVGILPFWSFIVQLCHIDKFLVMIVNN